MSDISKAFENKRITVYTAYDSSGHIIGTFFNKEDRDKAVAKNKRMERLNERNKEELQKYLKQHPAENPYYGLQFESS